MDRNKNIVEDADEVADAVTLAGDGTKKDYINDKSLMSPLKTTWFHI